MKNDFKKILLIDSMEDFPTHISIYGLDYTLLWMNKVSREQKRVELENLGKEKCYEMKGLSAPCESCLITKVIETEEPCETESLEYECGVSNHDTASWYQKAAPLRDKRGDIIAVLKISHNIAEHIKTREQLDRNKILVHDLVENSQDIIWTSTSKGTLEYVNPAMEKILGYKPAEITEKHYSELIHPSDLIKVMNIIPERIREKRGWENLTVRWKHRDGTYRTLESSSTPILDSRGRVIAYRGVDRDVTQREKLIAQLLQAQKMESVGRLAGGISHDFNNMLGVILGYLEMAATELDPSHPIAPYLKQAREAADRSINLTRQILAFARKQEIEPAPLALNVVVVQMLNMLRGLIGSDIELIWRPGKDLWQVEMDAHQVDQIMANLCVNARDAIKDVGKITISTKNQVVTEEQSKRLTGMIPGDYVLLSVKDTGHGMDKETLRKAFEPFFTTKPEGIGTGLGLSTVYGIVKQNNGFIYATSRPGKGCRFDIYLPKYSGGKESGKRRQISIKNPTGKESILLVDDDKAILGVIKLLLENLGYKVTTAYNPLDALKIYREHPDSFDLLVIDKIMPEMRGTELRDKIKEITPEVKYIFMSGHNAEDSEERIVIEEHEAFLQKPFTQKELGIKAREVLDEERDMD